MGLEEDKLPHFTTLQKFFERVVVANPGLIDELVGEVVAECIKAGVDVQEVAGDSTGVACSMASRHFVRRANKDKSKGKGRYIKLGVIVCCTTFLPIAVHAAPGPDHEMNGAWDLVWKASGRCNPQVAYYDAGFGSERFHAFHRVG